jgi:CBS domain-containing protein
MVMKAKDVSRKAIKLKPGNTLYDARNTMLRYNISRIVIFENDKLFGIITEKDIAKFLHRDVSNRRLDQINIDEAMSKIPVTVYDESDLNSSAKLMLDKLISSLIVVDSKNALKGIFTKSDLVEVYATYYTGRHVVEDYMTSPVHTVTLDDSSLTALSMMNSKKVSRIVVESNKKPVGVITSNDFLQISPYFTQHVYQPSKREKETTIPSEIRRVFLARDLIKNEPIVVLKDSDLAEAAQIMINNAISGLPVVDKNYELVGIVTKTDIVRALAES